MAYEKAAERAHRKFPEHELGWFGDTLIGVQNDKYNAHLYADKNGKIFHVTRTMIDPFTGAPEEIDRIEQSRLAEAAQRSGVEDIQYLGTLSKEAAATVVDFMLKDDLDGRS